LSSVTTANLTFQSVVRYNGPALSVHMSTDYNEGDPTSDGNWTELSVTLDTDTNSWSSWTDSGNIDLSSVTGGNLYIAFKYVSTTSGSATYEIDNVHVMGE
ncbi:MAG: choice-of-anchor J domain-containing protein, partial [Bacteroidota bacterium]|nr:choice-of-anchor J domain-containing protein [Bacteroidota bacterium]